MMKTLKIMQFIPEFGIAGAEKMVQDLSIYLHTKHHEVTVVSLFSFHSIITNYIESNNVKIIYLNKKTGLDLKVIRGIRNLICENKPDVIHTHRYLLPYVVIASLFIKVKRFHTIHNIAKFESTLKNRIFNWFVFMLRLVKPVAISSKVQNSISTTYGIKRKNIPVIFNGIDLSRCKPKFDYQIHEKIEIIHIGRFAPAKNHVNIVEAINLLQKKYPNIHLSCYGQGELFNEISKKVEMMNLENNITLFGVKPDVYSFLSGSDIFILPSIWEGAPITIIEAMATGLPIVTSNVGGIGEYIEHEKTGIIVEPSSNSIANGIDRLILDKLLREKVGKNALIASIAYSETNMGDGYINLYYGEINGKEK